MQAIPIKYIHMPKHYLSPYLHRVKSTYTPYKGMYTQYTPNYPKASRTSQQPIERLIDTNIPDPFIYKE